MARVIIPFRDRETWHAYAERDEYEGTPERVSELVAGGYLDSGLIAHDEEESGSESTSEDETGNLEGLTVAELRELARSRGIEAPSRATKPQLLGMLGS